jgi:DNA anti-recombination protein RmuC
LLDELDNVDSATAGTVSRAEEALESFNLLGDEQLEPLRRAIEDTRDQFRELADEIRQESADLQDELDRLRGNEAAIAERRFADRIKGLQDQLSEARRSNDRDLQTRAEENIRLLEQIRAAELAQEQADKQSDTNGSPRENNVTPLPVRAPAPSRTVRVQLQTADRESNLDLPDDQAEALIRQLEILNRSTGPRT